jgi:5-formyltetrahydrofolate cyclo-ligase
MNKGEMRSAMKKLLGGIAETDLRKRSARIARRLERTQAWKRSGTLLCFLSMPHEMDTTSVITSARAQGKTVAVPRIEGNDICFVVMPPDAGPLSRDRWGIPEPDSAWPLLDLARAGDVLVAVPGLAFDRQGNRLGRGKGYFDRFLAGARRIAKSVTALGVCFSEQLVGAVPHGDSDQPLDGAVTERETIMFERRGRA